MKKEEGWKECSRCGYSWKLRKKYPKECPRCKGRLDKSKE